MSAPVIPTLDCGPSNAWILNGTRLLVESDATPGTFLDIVEISTFAFPGGSGSDTEVTPVNVCDRYRRYISGLIDTADLSMTANWIPDDPSHDHLTGLQFMQSDGGVRNWKIICSDKSGLTIDFVGYVRDFTPSGGAGGDVSALDFTIKLSGAPVYDFTTPPAVTQNLDTLWGHTAAINARIAAQGGVPADQPAAA
jgi:hypothetical protein